MLTRGGHLVSRETAPYIPQVPELRWNKHRVYSKADGTPRDCELVDARELVAMGGWMWTDPNNAP